jgi:hypothetical protein
MTACFAGPLFNILVGLGMGFSSLAAQTGQSTREVSVSPSIATGFLFITVNSAVILVTGLWLGKGTIPKNYGYVAVRCHSSSIEGCGCDVATPGDALFRVSPLTDSFCFRGRCTVDALFHLLDCFHLCPILKAFELSTVACTGTFGDTPLTPRARHDSDRTVMTCHSHNVAQRRTTWPSLSMIPVDDSEAYHTH